MAAEDYDINYMMGKLHETYTEWKLKMNMTKQEIRRRMWIVSTVSHRMEENMLLWYGHVNRMPEERWPNNSPVKPSGEKKKRKASENLDAARPRSHGK